MFTASPGSINQGILTEFNCIHVLVNACMEVIIILITLYIVLHSDCAEVVSRLCIGIS